MEVNFEYPPIFLVSSMFLVSMEDGTFQPAIIFVSPFMKKSFYTQILDIYPMHIFFIAKPVPLP